MKIRTTFIFFFILLFTLAGLNIFIGLLLKKAAQSVEISQAEMHALDSIADDVVVSSQWQTRFARTYITNKDQRRFKWYKNIADILDGKISRPSNYDIEYWDLVIGSLTAPPKDSKEGAESVEDRFLKFNVTPIELNKLKEARIHLAKLSVTEQIAMHAIIGEFDDGTGAFARKGKPDQAMAQRILFSDEYNKGNADISILISQLKNMIDKRYGELISTQQIQSNKLLHFNLNLSLGIFALVVFSIIFLQQRYAVRASKLMNFVRRIDEDGLKNKAPVSGNDEIGELAIALNLMAEKLDVAFNKLEEKIKLSENTLKELEVERMRSDKLLTNILPEVIAKRLQNGEETIAEIFPEVTVLFCDIVGFTDLSAKLGPQGTVKLLSTLFAELDELAETHQVEKIKTIGDCYMVVGGVPKRDALHCQHIAEFALGAIKLVERLSANLLLPIKIRIGIHTGTVAAGVVGKKKFSYDLWGDVVNVASRFETTSKPDSIHVSEAVRVRLGDDFMFQDCGSVELKGKGTVASYFLLGQKKEISPLIKI
jgi:class 3 adenylate cyclase/HAMP domain-containing protein